MAAAADSYEQFVSQILRPTNFTSLKDPVGDTAIQIEVYTDPSTTTPSQTFLFEDFYPFQTVADLQTRIYIESGSLDEFHPQNQCLLKPSATPNKYYHFLYLFNNRLLELDNPFTLLQSGKPDSKFVDLTGNSKLVETIDQQNLLLETSLFKQRRDVYVLHLFLYRNLYQVYPGAKPVNRVDWEGMFRVYFPNFNKDYEDGSLTPANLAYRDTLTKRYTCRQQMIELINEHLQSTPLRKPGETSRGDSVNLSNIRGLRFFWKKPVSNPRYKAFDLESVFYDLTVSKDIPFILFYPKTSSPLSKIHVEGALNIPSIEAPELLAQWAEQKSITPDENLIMMKVLLRPGSGVVFPLYATMFIHEDGSAKFIVQPDANTKALTRQGDLFDLAAKLEFVSQSMPKLQSITPDLPPRTLFTPETIQLEDAYIVLSLWLEKEDTRPITKKSLYTVLPYYRPFFQVAASPLVFQNPIAFLRYKSVDNFQTPSRDFQFLHRVLDLQKLEGTTSIPRLVKYYMDEFDVPDVVAQTRVKGFLDDLTRFDLVDPVTTDYKQATNPGIDIAFFGRLPFYTVHIYRVNSLMTLRRIKTLLSLLVTLEEGEFEEIRKCYLTAEEEEAEAQAAANEEALAEAAEAVADTAEEEAPPPTALQAAAAASSAADAAGDMGDAFAFDGLGDFSGFGDEPAQAEEAAAAPPLETLASLDVPELPPAAAAPASKKKSKKDEDEEEEEGGEEEEEDEEADIVDVAQLKGIKAKTYFSKRLDFYDRRLFQYSKGKKGIKKYSSACAANALKQPIVMSEDEYARMRETYEPDVEAGKVLFIDYPLKKGQTAPAATSSKTERITTLRYGSSLLPGQANIYICSQYWCRQDDIVVLKADFEGTADRKGRPKEKNTCPFCRGGLVKDRLNIVKGETVIERITKSKSAEGKRHLFVRFLNKQIHPEGLQLPCCFLKDKAIFEDKHAAFASLKRKSEALAPGEPVVEAQLAAAEVEAVDEAIQYAVDYKKTLGNVKQWYILGAEKMPLEVLRGGPQIGILPFKTAADQPSSADKFFAQDSRSFVVNDHTVWKIVTKQINEDEFFPNGSGFLRIGVENRKRYNAESFLAAIAPFYGENSAGAMKQRILDQVTPLVFLSLNYGNFLFDFFDPTTPAPPPFVLKQFASKQLLLDSGIGLHKEAILRAWKGYEAFKAFMANTSKVKEFRQFAQLLSLPNLLYWTDSNNDVIANGIMFIVLEMKQTGELVARCPPYGITPEMAARCDVAFLLHYTIGSVNVWEPVIYTENNADAELSETYMVFRRDAEAGWPAVVKKRVAEYQAMCFSSGLGIYTDSSMINPKTLIPLSVGMLIDSEVKAILRDTYNHVSSILFRTDQGVIMVPVIDDGSVHPTTKVELDWRNFMRDLAPGSAAVDFYRTKVAEVLTTQPPEVVSSYTIDIVMRLDKSVPERPDMFALKLANGLTVPVRKPESGETTLESDTLEEGQEVPWMIDTKLVFGSKEPTMKSEVEYQEFEEIFQHLRLTFANWYAVQPPALRQEVNEILYKDGLPNSDLPLWEKRQRLFIKLGNEILSWLDSSIPQRDRKPSLKRVDCRVVRDPGLCSNRCVWREGNTAGCLLHVPEKYDVGTQQVDAKGLLIKKLIEEIIRFPIKRAELLNNKVRQYTKLTTGFRAGDQYIVPLESASWDELMRMEWTKDVSEQPRYLEEYSSIEPRVPSAPEEAEEPSFAVADMPELLVKYINNKALSDSYTYFSATSILPILEGMGITAAELESKGQVMDAPILITQEVVTYVAARLKLSVYQLLYEEAKPFSPSFLTSIAMFDEKTRAPFLFFVQLDDGSVGIISAESDGIAPIPMNKMPLLAQRDIARSKAQQQKV
jgi:hypothetical protein